MTKIVIKEIGPEQAAELRELAIKTYTETFGHDTTKDQLEAFFNSDYHIDVLTAELSSAESAHRFVYVDNTLAGYLKVNWGSAQTEHELENAFEIQRIYILKAFQGYGLGKRLFELALDIAKNSGFDWVWLGVWERNFKAQNFYAKYGFEKFAEHDFVVSKDKIDTDWLLKKCLN
ncbi:GNAT family N-acetyltransferase [Streptococcus pluranimalium]